MASVLNIIAGADKDFTVSITIAGGCNDGSPFDLTGAGEIICLFPNADGKVLSVKMTTGAITILSATTGKIRVNVLDTETVLFNIGQGQSFECQINIGSIISIVQFIGLLNVTARIFSS
jgi:hypothetical protein